jgi:hypothetical protein
MLHVPTETTTYQASVVLHRGLSDAHAYRVPEEREEVGAPVVVPLLSERVAVGRKLPTEVVVKARLERPDALHWKGRPVCGSVAWIFPYLLFRLTLSGVVVLQHNEHPKQDQK